MPFIGASRWFRKVKELRAEHQVLKEQLERYKVKERAADRSALLGSPRVEMNLTETTVKAHEDTTLRYAESRIEEYINIGTSTLDSLKGQRNIMKSTQRRVLDAGAQLGISQSVMRIISRRTAQDRYIFYGGVIFTLLVLYWVLFRW